MKVVGGGGKPVGTCFDRTRTYVISQDSIPKPIYCHAQMAETGTPSR